MAETSVKVLLALCLTLMFGAQVQAQDIEQRYKKSCAVCHASGAAGAPKTGAADQWAPRLQKGMDALVESVENGLNAMPPKGMCFDCSKEDFAALITLMAKPR